MAKTLSEELLGLLDADTQTKVRAALAANPGIVAKDLKAIELYDVYEGLSGEPITTTVTHTPTVPVTAATPVTTATTTAASSGSDMAAVLAKLDSLKSELSSTVDEKLKGYIAAAKVPELRTELLTLAIKTADDYATIRENHRAEFSKPLDRTAFEKFVADQKAANIGYPSLSAAHDEFVKTERATLAETKRKADIDAAVAEALKQKRSAESVPGQTQSTGLSPAAQVMAKARAGAGGDNNESAAMRVARQLEALDESRSQVH